MTNRETAIGLGVGLLLSAHGCAAEDAPPIPTGLEQLAIADVQPRSVVPGTTLRVRGASFLDEPLAHSAVRLRGTIEGRAIEATFDADFEDYDRMSVQMTASAISKLGTDAGRFEGSATATAVFVPNGSRYESNLHNVELTFAPHLEPKLDYLETPHPGFINDAIEVQGSGLLFGGDEGDTVAVVRGCFTPEGEATCQDVGTHELVVQPSDPDSRDVGTFRFSPQIAGVGPGTFDGEVTLENRHAGGEVLSSQPRALFFSPQAALITSVSDGVSLGGYFEIHGGGFVGSDDGGGTFVRLVGDFLPDDAANAVEVSELELAAEFVDGRRVRYTVNEGNDQLGQALDLRVESGTFNGEITPVVQFGDGLFEGTALPVTFRLEPVKQVVFVDFKQGYVEALRKFGLRALDSAVRARILEVVRRDYETINVEFREAAPDDFELYATVDIAGPDVNGLGLLGYDNTTGKDVFNARLADHIGSINAGTMANDDPAFGGVFIESIFTFSQHPPDGVVSQVPTPLFDEIFDPFRADRGGTPVSSRDFTGAGIPTLRSGGSCPASDRRLQAGCAVWVLGSVIGSTVSHELGHSLGLAEPLGSDTRFHNIGDAPNRLMDEGGLRSFSERAELMGQGPSRLCVESYEYLRQILPTDAPMALDGRERC